MAQLSIGSLKKFTELTCEQNRDECRAAAEVEADLQGLGHVLPAFTGEGACGHLPKEAVTVERRQRRGRHIEVLPVLHCDVHTDREGVERRHCAGGQDVDAVGLHAGDVLGCHCGGEQLRCGL